MEVVAGLSTDSAPKAARSSGARYRSALTNSAAFLPKRPLTRRAVDRRRKDLVTAFLSALPAEQACSDLTMVAVRRAAELQAMCEMARADMLNGQPVDMLALVRLEGVAARAIRALGIKVEPPPAKAHGLELARQRWAENAERAKRNAEKASATKPPEAPDG